MSLLLRISVGTPIAMILVACGGSQLPKTASGAFAQINRSSNASYKLLHSFTDRHDGQVPKAGLTDMGGTLYGTTYGGGHYEDGTIFRISTTGKEKVLYNFKGSYLNDGANPAAGLLAANGALYGTTEYGGIPSDGGCNAGTVFRMSTSGAENVLYRFYGYNCHDQIYYDGADPVANLIKVKGKLYGTTYNGGLNNAGTVFKISPSGNNENILHSFVSYYDGTNPTASLLYMNGSFYGTTQIGPGEQGSNLGYGTVFTMSPSGAEAVLFAFYPPPYGSDGEGPEASLISVDGILYSTTAYGGSNYSGTAFSVTTAGSVTLLHNFGTGEDGSRSTAALLNVQGTLYGTTSAGGVYGGGTIFSLSPTGTEKVLHNFGYGSDGAIPLAGLIDVKGTLYGTTSAGGTQGEGTVFALRP